LEQNPIKHFGKSSGGHTQRLSKIFWDPIYSVHSAVIFAVAHLYVAFMIAFVLWLLGASA